MTYEVTIPEIGESITEALIVRWIKQPGDAIGRDEPLVELETDKVTVEMPCPVAGVVSELVCAEGETVPIGAVIARIEEGAAAAAGPAATPTVSTQTDLLSTAEPAPRLLRRRSSSPSRPLRHPQPHPRRAHRPRNPGASCRPPSV